MDADDYFGIQNLINRYFELVDAGRLQDCAALFAHARMHYLSSGEIVDRDPDKIHEIMQSFVRLYGDPPSPLTRHHSGNICIYPEADGKAHATSSAIIVQATPSFSLQVIAEASYADNFEKAEGQWRFTERKLSLNFVGDLSAHLKKGIEQ
ncbi:MAG: nuclear transport factor 2 family protein [Pseudomonadota bacterium]